MKTILIIGNTDGIGKITATKLSKRDLCKIQIAKIYDARKNFNTGATYWF